MCATSHAVTQSNKGPQLLNWWAARRCNLHCIAHTTAYFLCALWHILVQQTSNSNIGLEYSSFSLERTRTVPNQYCTVRSYCTFTKPVDRPAAGWVVEIWRPSVYRSLPYPAWYGSLPRGLVHARIQSMNFNHPTQLFIRTDMGRNRTILCMPFSSRIPVHVYLF